MDGVSNTAGPPTEALAGLVERVTFHNADTGFCVLRVKVRGGMVQNVPFPGNTNPPKG